MTASADLLPSAGPLPGLVAGLGVGLSLIVAIGAQNAFVLRQGIRAQHVLPIVAVCTASDAILILAGVTGIGVIVERAPVVLTAVRWAGAAFLVGYGLLAARRALGSQSLTPGDADGSSLRTALLTVLALTWLNPHVYLDTVFLAGSVAAAQGEGRWAFVLGASLASITWFTALGYGARGLGRWLSTPRAWRVLDAVIAVVMVAIAISLLG